MNSVRTIYLIDDDDIFRLYAERMLAQLECLAEVCSFSSAQNALDQLQKDSALGATPPALIFVDINMPVLDGWDFLDQLTRHGRAVASRVYLVSSSIFEEDERKAAKYPRLQGFLHKPLKRDALKDILVAAGLIQPQKGLNRTLVTLGN